MKEQSQYTDPTVVSLVPLQLVVIPHLYPNIFYVLLSLHFGALQRQNAENLKQIFPEKKYRGLSPNFHIHV